MNYYYYKNCLLSVAFWGQERVLYVQEKKPFPFNLVKTSQTGEHFTMFGLSLLVEEERKEYF